MPTSILVLRGLLVTTLAGLPLLSAAATFQFSIDTTPLNGQSGYFAFDLYQGDLSTSNQVVIASFSSLATLGTPTRTGGVTGTLQTSVVFNSTTFFSEFLQPLVFAAGATTFQLTTTQNYTAGNVPDSLAIFLLNNALVPFATSDPTGANALLAIDLGSTQTPQLYTSTFAAVSVIPEPTGALLFLAGLPLVVRWSSRRSRRNEG